MALALGATAIVVLALFWELATPSLRGLASRSRTRLAQRRERARRSVELAYDPGRELRAEQRARALLRSCVNDEEWAMYRDLGFLRVRGAGNGGSQTQYAYLIYPHKPIVAYMPQSGAILNEYCVAFNRETPDASPARLPDADDVLAKWMLLAADERSLLEQANMHMPGRQVDPEQVKEDLARLRTWEHARATQRLRGAESCTSGAAAMTPRRRVAGPELTSRVVRR
jgi:hypothetical protein